MMFSLQANPGYRCESFIADHSSLEYCDSAIFSDSSQSFSGYLNQHFSPDTSPHCYQMANQYSGLNKNVIVESDFDLPSDPLMSISSQLINADSTGNNTGCRFMYEDPLFDGVPYKTSETFNSVFSSPCSNLSYSSDYAPSEYLRSWRTIHPHNWNSEDVLNFVYSLANEGQMPLDEVRGEAFQDLSGPQLCEMKLSEFETKDPKYGKYFFEAFGKLLEEGNFLAIDNTLLTDDLLTLDYFDYPTTVPTVVAKLEGESEYLPQKNLNMNRDEFVRANMFPNLSFPNHITDEVYQNPATDTKYTASADREAEEMPTVRPQNKRGRPLKRRAADGSDEEQPPTKRSSGHEKTNKVKHLWEFICQLLKNNKGMGKDNIIQWENKDLGVFRVVNSKMVAFLWGKHKCSNKMTFEKLSRALRWCKTSGSMAELPNDGKYPKRLCFRFGPRAVNWRTLAF